ncbi:MAG: cytochrome c oxidase subunit I, partial [Candidatus Limnocylindrales bacterium]
MNAQLANSEAAVSPGAIQVEAGGLTGWLTTTDHKRVGLLYITSSFAMFLVGGLMAEMMRTELAQPGLQLLTAESYDQLFTMHGTIMLLLFGTPMAIGLGNYIVPLQIGAADMSFPRLNALSFWLFLVGALTILSGFVVAGGPAAAGWTGYVPLSGPSYEPGAGLDLWIVGLAIVGISGVLSALNLIVTIYTARAPGMSLLRMPIFTWN